MCTSNACESFHSKLNSMFYSSNPNIFQFLEVLINVQTDVYIKMHSSNQTQKRRMTVEKENYIHEIINYLKSSYNLFGVRRNFSIQKFASLIFNFYSIFILIFLNHLYIYLFTNIFLTLFINFLYCFNVLQ